MLKARSRVVDVPGVVWALTRSLFIVAVMLALLVSSGVAYAQGTSTVPTIESVAVTSDPGEDGGYAIGDEIQVGLTFSEAVTVTGIPQLTLDVGGRSRTVEYSEGSTTTRLLFTYTVPSGDEDTDGIAVVANSLALNGGAIRADQGDANAALTHPGLQSDDHKVDAIAPTVTVGGETRTYVPPDRQFNVVFYFSEKVYGITDSEITVANGMARDVRVTSGNDQYPRHTRWDVIIVPAAVGPVTVDLPAGAATDAYGNPSATSSGPLRVVAADPVTVEVARTTSGFAEGGRAEFLLTRSRDNGTTTVSLSLSQTGDFLSGTVEVYGASGATTTLQIALDNVTTNLEVTFEPGEVSKTISVLTVDDYRDESDGSVTLQVTDNPAQYRYIPGFSASADSAVRDNDTTSMVSLYWRPPIHPYTTATLDAELEGSYINLTVLRSASAGPLSVTLGVAEEGNYLDLDGSGAYGFVDLGTGELRIDIPAGRHFANVAIPLLDDDLEGADGSVSLSIQADPEGDYDINSSRREVNVPIKDNDAPSTVTLSAPARIIEGTQVSYTLTRTWEPGQSQNAVTVQVQIEQTGDYISWPEAHQPGTDGVVTITITFADRSLTANLVLHTVDDEVAEAAGRLSAVLLATDSGSYTVATTTAVVTTLYDNERDEVSVEAVDAEITEGTDAQFRFIRAGDTGTTIRVGLWVVGLPKIMTDATESIVLTSGNEGPAERLTLYGASVDYILEFSPGETEKTLLFTTEADNVNEGDGWLGVRIVRRSANPFDIGTDYAQVHIKDDDIPTVTISQVMVPTGTTTLDGDTWVADFLEGNPFSWVMSCSGDYEYSLSSNSDLRLIRVMMETIRLANHPEYYPESVPSVRYPIGNNWLSYVNAGFCDGQARTSQPPFRYVGPDGGVETFELVLPVEEQPSLVKYREAYRQAKEEADQAGTLVTQRDIIHPGTILPPTSSLLCTTTPENLRYCPQYRVGTPHKIRLNLINRDPTILIKAETTEVVEGQPVRFEVERRWNDDLLEFETTVLLRASQNGHYVTASLPTQIVFGRNATSTVIELETVDDSAFGDNGSVTIELLPDTTGSDLNTAGKYERAETWLGHTPKGGRSDRATISIINDDYKPGITIAPAWATEGDSGTTAMTFTVSLTGSVNTPVQVEWATSDGTAIAGEDYTAAAGTATIPANATSTTFTVTVTGDEIDEIDETFYVTISLPDFEPASNGAGDSELPAGIVGGVTATATGMVLDDDPATVAIMTRNARVEEGEVAFFTLTRSGVTSEELEVAFVLSGSGHQEMLNATFKPGSTTTEVSHTTTDDNYVNYPPERDYEAVLLGDSLGADDLEDSVWTPGNPASATVTVTDNDDLQIVTVEPVKPFVSTSELDNFRFLRTGDLSQSLDFEYHHLEADLSRYTNFSPSKSATFEAGKSEWIACFFCDYAFVLTDDVLPFMKTVLLYGDGGRNGLHRTWKAGVPNTATVVHYNDGAGEGLELHAEYSNTAALGEQVKIKFTVMNTAHATSGTDLVDIGITSVQRDFRDRGKDRQAEDRAGCTIDGPINPGESGMCTATFTVNPDDVDNAPMELDATAAATTTDGIAASAPVRIYIKIRDGIVVGFKDDSNLVVTESATTTADLVVKREGSLSEEFQVAYVTGVWGSTATAGEDYADRADPPGIITFDRNQSEATISFHIIDDEIDEERERFQVALIPSEGVLVPAASSTRVVVIIDAHQSNDPYRPTASLQLASSGAVPEDQGSIVFAVVLDREWGRNAQYKVELLPDQLTATPVSTGSDIPGDFEDPGTVRVYIPAGETRAEFSVTLYDDDVREEDETFKLQLGSSDVATARTIGATSTALATIVDDERIPPAEVVLSLTHMDKVLESVPESADRSEVTVTAYFPEVRWPGDPSDAPLRPADPRDVDTVVRVQVDPNSGAANLVDFKPLKVKDAQGIFKKVESFDILIPVGGTSATATLLFRPVDDRIDEENETFILQGNIVDARGSTETNLPVTSASFSIDDDDTRGITVTPESVLFSLALTEGGPPESYSMVLDSQPTGTVTITLASEQDGLLRLMPDTLTFTASDWDTPKMVSVWALDDGKAIAGGLESDRIIEQVSGGDYADQDVSDIPVYISDTTKTYVYLEDAQASESDGHIKFKVTVRPILHTANFRASYATVDGTAIAGQDYTAATSSFTVGSGQGSATIRIPIIDNQVYEPAEKTFTLQLWSVGDRATLAGDVEVLTATGTIMDDETKPVVTIAGPEGALSYVSENAMEPLTFTLTLNGVSAKDVTVDYATDEAKLLGLLSARHGLTDATPGEDYVPATGTVTFAPGQTTKTVNVEVTNDDVSEDTEFFGLRISNPQNARIRARQAENSADVGLLDNDLPGATIQPKSLMLAEPARGASTTVSGAYNVVLTSQPTDEVTISVGGQYEGMVTLSTTTLTFATSTWNIPQRVEVTLVRDSNAVSESVVLTHTPSGGDYTGLPLDSVTVSVRDSDTRGITVSRDELTLTEGGSNTYTVVLDSQPTATTTVTVTGAGSVSPTSSELTFATSNWNEPQTVTLTAAHDGDTSDEPKVSVRHEASGGDYNGLHGPDVGVTVRDDDTEVIVSFEQGTYDVDEGSTTTITVKLSADPERTVVIPLEKTDLGGVSDVDYSGVPSEVTFDSGETEKTFTFSATQDIENDDGESVRLSFGPVLSAGVTIGTPDVATVSLNDNDDPQVTVSFGQSAYTVAEGSSASITVTLDADPERTVVIPLEKTGQGGVSDVDYSGVPTSVTFDSGETEKSFTFVAVDDEVDDDDERVELSFGSPPAMGVTAGTHSQAVVTIRDDDDPQVTVSFGQSEYTVSEGSTVTVTVTLDADPERTVTIPIATTGLGGATDADYSGVPSEVTFDSGETEKTFTFIATQDTENDDGESVSLSFGSPPAMGVTAGTHSQTVVTIRDDDDPQVVVSFSQSEYTVDEGATTTITVTLDKDPERTVEIRLEKTEVDGVSSADYSGVPSEVTFDSGETEKTFTFSATQDIENDDGESVSLSFGSPPAMGVTAGTHSQAVVTIRDDDDPQVVVSFSQSEYTVDEGATTTITVTLDKDPERTVEIRLEKTEVDGVSSADYSGVPSEVTFDSGETEKTFTFSATQDIENDDGESVSLSFGSPPAMGVTAGTHSQAVVTIRDDDDPQVTVSFGQSAYTVAEGSSASITVTLDADPERTVVVPLEKTGQGGVSDVDYSGVPSEVTFNSGETEKTFTFVATQDSEDDDGESVALGFGDLPGGIRPGALATTTIEIADDDVPSSVSVSFTSNSYSVSEGATTTITVTLDKDPERTVEIRLEKTEVDGVSSADYSGVPTSVTFDSGETEKSFTFVAVDDEVDDDDERVELSFGSPPAMGVTAGTHSQAVVTIRDDDDPQVTVSFGQSAYTVSEGSTVTVTVTLDADPERTVTIPIATTGQGGVSDVDYSGVPSEVTFDSGETEKTFAFIATQDTENDDGESVSLSFGSPPAMGVTAGTHSQTVVTIRDDDDPQVTVSFSQSEYTVSEGATTTITVSLDADPEREVTIPITTANLGGASDSDYSGVSESLTFEKGVTERSFVFSAARDNLSDAGESVELTFTTLLPPGVDPGATTTATVRITDVSAQRNTPSVSFETGTYRLSEGATTTVKVRLSVAPGSDVTIPITATPMGGATSTDYSGVPASVTYGSSDTEASFTFVATQDSEDDDGESVALGFGDLPGGIRPGALATTTIEIADDDVPSSVSVSFTSNSYSVSEGATTTITVTLDKDPERTVEIRLEKTEVDGVSSADYSGVPTSVTFDSGETEKSFTFVAVDDEVDDDDERVELSFGSPPAMGVTAGTHSQAVVTIRDDDDPQVTVSFGQSAYTVSEGSTVTVTVTLDADPERTVTIPIATTGQGGVSDVDYSGVPSEVTFDSGETERTFAFIATQDIENDDGESVSLSFGSPPAMGVTAGTHSQTVVTIRDDDDPQVVVSFSQSEYTVDEGATTTITVSLDADPEREVTIPITTANLGGASDSDYSGVSESLTFEKGVTERSFVFSAARDNLSDAGESVELTFTTLLPPGVDPGATTTATVRITDVSAQRNTPSVSFETGTYRLSEGATTTVKVRLSVAPGSDVTIPITATPMGGATSTDYSGVPASVTYGSSDTEASFTFVATHDSEDDDGESVALGFGDLPGGIRPGALATTTIEIADDDVPSSVSVSFTSNSYSVSEGATTTITVTLDKDPERTVEIRLEKTEVDGVSSADYSGVPTSVTFDSGETEKSFTFVAVDDEVDDDDERVELSFGSPPAMGVTAGTHSQAVVTIRDDDDPQVTVSFGQSAYTVSEGSTVTVTVTLDADPERTVVVPLEKTGQGGVSDVDYSGVPSEVTFNSGETEKTFTFVATQDIENDDGESVSLSFGSPPAMGVTAGTHSQAVVTIRDDDDPQVTVSFGQSEYTVSEGSTVTVTVTLDADPERTVTIPIATTGLGGATDADHSGVPPSVTFGSGETEKTFAFIATQDTENDDGESVSLSFGSPPAMGVTAGTHSQTVVTIRDDDDPQVTVSFSQSEYTVSEGSTVTVTVTLDADPERTVTIPIATTGLGGATDADYSGVPSEVTFDSGETEKTFTFSATQDIENDDGESVRLSFGPVLSAGVTIGTPDVATVSLNDNDDPQVTVSFRQSAYIVSEGSSVPVSIQLSREPESTVTVPITVTPEGDATAADYSIDPVNVTFSVGQTVGEFTFSATQDDQDDDGDSVALGVGELPGGITIGATATSRVSILDDDERGVIVSPASIAMIAGNSNQYTLVLNSEPIGDVTVEVTGHDATDLTVNPQRLTFNAGNWNSPQTVMVTANHAADSTVVYLSHTVSGADYDSTTASGISVHVEGVTDEELLINVGVDATQRELAVPEGGSNTYGLLLNSEPSGAVTIDIDLPAGNDLSLSQDSLVFTVSNWHDVQFVTVSASDDEDTTTDPAVDITHTVSGGGYENTAVPSVTATIIESDVPGVTLSRTSLTIEEGGSGTYTVKLNTGPESPVTVTVVDPSNSDIAVEPASLEFTSTDWNSEKTVTVTVGEDDDALDESGTVTHTVSGADYGGVDVEDVEVHAIDNDNVQVAVSFEHESYMVNEGATTSVSIVLDADPERTVTIPIFKTNLGGASDDDSMGVPGSVTFLSGETEKFFTFAASQDTEIDDGESVSLTFRNLPDDVSRGATATTTISIVDDDMHVVVRFGSATYSATEGEDDAHVTVELSIPAPRAVVIPLTAEGHAGAVEEDWTGVPASLEFDTGDISKSFTVTAVDDELEDNGEMVVLSFGPLDSDFVTGTPSTATITLMNDDDNGSDECGDAIWCATLRFATTSSGGGGYEDVALSDSDFLYEGLLYQGIYVRAKTVIDIGAEPVLPFRIPERSQFYFVFLYCPPQEGSVSGSSSPSPKTICVTTDSNHYLDWTLQVEYDDVMVELPFSEGRLEYGDRGFKWYGPEFYELLTHWTQDKVYSLRIVKTPLADIPSKPPGPPLYPRVRNWNSGELAVAWVRPQTRTDNDRVVLVDHYRVQMKEASGSWDDPDDVTEKIKVPKTSQPVQRQVFGGLTFGVEYQFRVFAKDNVGESGPSSVATGTLD